MAVTHFTFGVLDDHGIGVRPTAYEAKTPSGSSSATTAAAAETPLGTAQICMVTSDTDVYVAFGANPSASATTGMLVLGYGPPRYFPVNVGDKAAVKTV